MFALKNTNVFFFKLIIAVGPFFVFLIIEAQPNNYIQIFYQNYDDNNGLRATQPYLKISKALNQKIDVNLHISTDAITAASRRVLNPVLEKSEYRALVDSLPVDAISSASTRWVSKGEANLSYSGGENHRNLSVDAISSASTFEKRKELGTELQLFLKNITAGLRFGISKETDYDSKLFGLSSKIDLLKKNVNIDLDYTRYHDILKPVRESHRFGEVRRRFFDDIKLTVAQTLSSWSLGILTYNLTLSNMFGSWENKNEKMLGNVYYPVLIRKNSENSGLGGSFIWESYPEEKTGHAVNVKFIQGYPTYGLDGSFHIDGSLYKDNWGLDASAIKLSLKQYLLPGFFVDLQYRYYRQTGVFFYRDVYHQNNLDPNHKDFLSYYTADPGLSPLSSHLAKIRFVFQLNSFESPMESRDMDFYLSKVEFEISKYNRSTSENPNTRLLRYEFYDSKGLEAWVFRIGITFNY